MTKIFGYFRCGNGIGLDSASSGFTEEGWQEWKDREKANTGQKQDHGRRERLRAKYDHERVGFREEGPIDFPLQRGWSGAMAS